ncbi:MAG: phosphoribosylamine--glycine ligase [Verrucomicrobia bacterium]|nr:phosphoribosylamine--glycine ligase [Verrucomicrobiota bacterium]
MGETFTVLIVGGGGREHALGWKFAQDPRIQKIWFAPGNAGTARVGKNLPIPATDVEGITRWAEKEKPGLVVVGPEAPLCAGLADRLRQLGIRVFGPGAKGAQLEGSKSFCKDLLVRQGIPTARAGSFSRTREALVFLETLSCPVVVKADGLAAGKGVVIAESHGEAKQAMAEMMEGRVFGDAGAKVVLEEFLVGEELSLHAVTDGKNLVLLPSAQDHKRVGEGDTGLNTGGMGAYSPAPRATPELLREVETRILRPTLAGLAALGIEYRGVLYAGLMLTADGPMVLEYNCRFGDPETEVLLPLLDSPVWDLLVAAAEGNLGKAEVRTRAGAAMTVVMAAQGYPARPVLGQRIEFGVEVPDTAIFHAGTREGNGGAEVSGGRVLAVTGWGDDLRIARDRAYGAVGTIDFQGKHFRRDIGHRALGKDTFPK